MVVTIKKDSDVKRVTKGAYENFYKGMGYTIEKGKQESKPLYKDVEVISKKDEKVEKLDKADK